MTAKRLIGLLTETNHTPNRVCKLVRSIDKLQLTRGFESRNREDHIQKRLQDPNKPRFNEEYTGDYISIRREAVDLCAITVYIYKITSEPRLPLASIGRLS